MSAELDAIRAGNEDAFRVLAEVHRPELRAHCYRMVGSLDDADELVQDTLVAAWRGLEAFEGRSSLRTWLYRIATNRCLNAIRDGRRRPPPAPEPPFAAPPPSRTVDVPWLQPHPDADGTGETDRADPARSAEEREAIELAFVTALQRLPARQTAALLLCDVVGFTIAEVAGLLEVPPTTVKGVLQRARAGIATASPAAAGRRAAPEEEASLARRFADAFTADDIDGVVALLTDDAWLAMPPALHDYRGRSAIAGFLAASASWRAGRRLGLVATTANTQPAFGCYFAEDPAAPAPFTGIIVLTTVDGAIGGITRFMDPGLRRWFALPPELAPGKTRTGPTEMPRVARQWGQYS
ncbi:MAG: RNA polymerase subunit sigma-70 [Actinomycetota bacterium]|nr:RNA polymerase subunit sigma-70 [Actinomycetota bacterium]